MPTLVEYKCPCCGGAIEFDSSLQKMKCPFCDTEYEVDTLKQYDDELKEECPDKMEWESAAGGEWESGEADKIFVYVCNSCGGEIAADESTAATKCPYCDSNVVIAGNLSGSLKPDLIIPFKLNREDAKKAFHRHLSGKLLLPKVFKTEAHIDEIKGIYVPFWLFDTAADARVRYRATRIFRWSDSNYIYTRTSHYSVVRAGSIAYDGIPVDGSSKMQDELMESIEPFDASGMEAFKIPYLSGYLADKYDVSAEASVERANQRVRKSTEDAFRRTVRGYATVIPENTNIKLRDGRSRYALYPVWILNTTWQDKKYTFAMNGQTGKLVGDLPCDYKKYSAWLLGLTACVSALAFGISYIMYLL